MNRDKVFDFLRSVAVFSALIFHYHCKVYLGILVKPFLLIVNYLFTIGGFFFFVSGFMSYRIYYVRFLENPLETSRYLIKKGLFILLVYFVYLVFMYVLTSTQIPSDIVDFLLMHNFFSKVLFTFGVLFLLTPFFLFLYSRFRFFPYFCLFLLPLVDFYCQEKMTDKFFLFIASNPIFGYPLLPSLFVFVSGFLLSMLPARYERAAFFLALAIFVFVLVSDDFRTKIFVKDRKYFTFIESITPFCCAFVLRPVMTLVSRFYFIDKFLVIGRDSLVFYVLSNMFIVLADIGPEDTRSVRFLGLVFILFLAYLFTYWHFVFKNSVSRKRMF